MLRKLLRYDFKAVLKYWWIAALSSFVLSFVGGWCISIFANEKELPTALYIVATLLMIVVVLGFVAFTILSTILIFSRFYKNFFTDEGYLTFTLPVKRSQLLISKLIMSTGTNFLTILVILIDVFVMMLIGIPELFLSKEFWQEFLDEFVFEIIRGVGAYYAVYVIEVLVILVLLAVFLNLFMFCCITVASIIAKKAKVVTAIGIYYVANSIFTVVVQMFYLFGIESLSSWLYNVPISKERPVFMVLLLGIILFISIFCGVLYSIQYWMLDRKLNLS